MVRNRSYYDGIVEGVNESIQRYYLYLFDNQCIGSAFGFFKTIGCGCCPIPVHDDWEPRNQLVVCGVFGFLGGRFEPRASAFYQAATLHAMALLISSPFILLKWYFSNSGGLVGIENRFKWMNQDVVAQLKLSIKK